jgi:hypothetical protein
MEIKIKNLTPDGFILSEVSKLAKHGVSIAVDFDSTLCLTDGYPNIVGVNGDCFSILHKWQDIGCKILLHTMRNNGDLEAAVKWSKEQGFIFDGVNCNPEADERYPGYSQKMYAVFYIDDKSFGTPLLHDTDGRVRDHVDWQEIDKIYTPYLEKIITSIK